MFKKMHIQNTMQTDSNTMQTDSNIIQVLTCRSVTLDCNVQYAEFPANDEGTVNCSIDVHAKEYDAESAKANRNPIDIVLLIDTSESIGKSMSTIKDSLKKMVKNLLATDRVSLITFGGYAEVVMSLRELNKNNTDKLLNSIDSLRSWGTTPMNSAIILGLQELRKSFDLDRRQYFLLFTDGLPSDSSPETIIQNMQSQMEFFAIKPKLFTIGYTKYCAKDLLETISKMNYKSGTFKFIEKEEDIDGAIMTSIGILNVEAVKNSSVKIECVNTDIATIGKVHVVQNKLEQINKGVCLELGKMNYGVTKNINFDVNLKECDIGSTVNIIVRFIGFNSITFEKEESMLCFKIGRNNSFIVNEGSLKLVKDKITSTILSNIVDIANEQYNLDDDSLKIENFNLEGRQKLEKLLSSVEKHRLENEMSSEDLNEAILKLRKAIAYLAKGKGKSLSEDPALRHASSLSRWAKTTRKPKLRANYTTDSYASLR